MIVKIKSHKRAVFGRVLQYMVGSKDRLIDPNGRSFIITHNLKSRSLANWEKQYRDNEALRLRHRKDSVLLTHEILSWHKDDSANMTLEKMEAIAREYIRQRNPKGLYVAVPHFDKEHYHVHLCVSGLEYKTGKSLRMSRSELGKLKKDIQQYQIEKYAELSKSTVRHGLGDRSAMTDTEYQIKRRTGRETGRELVSAMLKTCYKKANSKETFLELLKESGLKIYERSGKVTGVMQNDGTKFRFSRLGFTEERLRDLEKTNIRGRDLGRMREKESRIMERERSQPIEKEEEIKPILPSEKEAASLSRQEELNAMRTEQDNQPREQEPDQNPSI